MKSLCIDVRMYRSSGIGVYIRNILKGLQKSGKYNIQLIVSDKESGLPDFQNFDFVVASSDIYTINEQIEIPYLIRKCDIFWSPNYNAPILPIRAKKRVVTIHDVCHLAFQQDFSFIKKTYAKLFMLGSVRLSDAILTISNFSKNEIIRYTNCRENKIFTVPIASDPSCFFPSKLEEKILFLDSQGLKRDYILYIGNVKPHKNIKGLIEAFRDSIEKKIYDLDLVVLGKSFQNYPLKEDIKQDPFLRDRVYFLDSINDESLKHFYSFAKCLVLPSYYEGFGMTPLEAMHCGCPTVVSNAASIPEVCGDASVYFNPYSKSSIAKSIAKVVCDPETSKELIYKGFNQIKKFSWEKTVFQIETIFDEIV